MKKLWSTLIALSFGSGIALSATLMPGYTIGASSQLIVDNGGMGTNLFLDYANLDGNDTADADGTNVTFSVLFDGLGSWRSGDTVEITGFAFPVMGSSSNGTMTFDIRQASGGTGNLGAGGLASLGTRTAAYTNSGDNGTMYVNFDTPVSFVVDTNSYKIGVNFGNSTSLVTRSSFNSNVRRYNYVTGDASGGYMNISLAGNVIAAAVSGNNAPVFSSASYNGSSAYAGTVYFDPVLEGEVVDPDNDVVTLSATSFSGPGSDWLGFDGLSITGTPQVANIGVNEWTIQADDGNGGTTNATLTIEVTAPQVFGLSAWWDFEETVASPNSNGGYIYDEVASIPGGLFNTLYTTGALSVPGKFGSATTGGIYLDGNRDNMVISTNDTLAVQPIGDFSIALWIKPDGAQLSFARLVDTASNLGGAPHDGYRLNTTGTAGQLQFAAFGGVNVSSANSFTTNEWNLVVVRYESGGTVSLNILNEGNPVDAAFVTTNSTIGSAGTGITYATDKARIGAGNANNAEYEYKGWMDDLAFYSGLLTDEQISAMFYGGVGAQPPVPEIGNITISSVGSDVVVSWPGSSVGTYTLQQKTYLPAASWSNLVTDIPGVDGTVSITNSATENKAFFRVMGQ